MSSDQGPLPTGPTRVESDLALPEGLEAGLMAGLAVALVYLVRDLANGVWLHTPSVLGSLMLFGPEEAREVESAFEVAAVYNFVHFGVWTALGFGASMIAKLAERRQVPPAALLSAALLAFLMIAFGLDAWVLRSGLPRTHLWIGGLVGGATLVAFEIWRHPKRRAARAAR